MLTKYILGALSLVFLALAMIRIAGGGAKAYPQVRTWLIIGVIFAAVSTWLFFQETI